MEKPDGFYKFASVDFKPMKSINKINRQTYSFFEWLGDIGGLLDAVLVIAELALWHYSKFRFSSLLMKNLFRVKLSSVDEHPKKKMRQPMKKKFNVKNLQEAFQSKPNV